jgi:hypothetical protein
MEETPEQNFVLSIWFSQPVTIAPMLQIHFLSFLMFVIGLTGQPPHFCNGHQMKSCPWLALLLVSNLITLDTNIH